jgi:uncharacterized protein (DUF1330 family)
MAVNGMAQIMSDSHWKIFNCLLIHRRNNMSAYIIVGFTPKNTELLQEYGTTAAQTIVKYKGEFLVKGPPQDLQGKYPFKNQVIIAFPTRELAESWYISPEYQAIIPLREQGMEAHFQLVG